ncbi:zinc finger protein 2-like [Plodia interpunctella]|uniref:zinc finger protein 2-like n=1 Tax=Plodia interpunctella TaxID=58824 RepID=UPI002367E775|nr:zinc finger protein 2-like [Plodia interpunctella]
MTSILDLKLVINHLLNGDLEENLCRICFQPLAELRESIFTKISKEDQDYCIADVLEELCGITFEETDKYFVCLECFRNASNAYSFCLKTKRSNEIFGFYVNEIESYANSVVLPDSIALDSLCISLPEFTPSTPDFDYNLDGVLKQVNSEANVPKGVVKKEKQEEEDTIVIIKSENGLQTFYKPLLDGSLVQINMENKKPNVVTTEKKMRKKREPMLFKQCSRCPIKYRFVAKLKEHMRTEHGIVLYACKICQALMEDEFEFRQHLKTHTNVHQCELCDTIFHKRETMIAHIKWHESKMNTDANYVCKVCGEITNSEEELQEHSDKKHYKNYTCYYCGRMYKGKISFDKHIEKHEKYLNGKALKQLNPVKTDEQANVKRFTCETCGRNFLGERALVWHKRLHTNERPYTCEECGRGFVSENRRKQHSVCAHSAPARRCPLCPALFHLRSMVNTHIKKVHLKAHKRRNRSSRHQRAMWPTQPVPIQELSVDIQNQILELQASGEHEFEV